MRLCFYNPHVILGKTLSHLVFGSGVDTKYAYLLNFFRNKKYNTAIVIDGTASSLTGGSLLVRSISNNYVFIRIISFIEIFIWCWLNDLNPFKQKIIFNKKGLDKQKDVIFGFAFFTDTFINEKMVGKSFLKNFQGVKVLHVSHFFSRTRLISDNVRKLNVSLAVAEADLKKSTYFNKYFDFIDKVYVLPFILRDRYRSNENFRERKNKCFATGTLLVLCSDVNNCHADYKEYVNYFGTGLLQPIRSLIYEEREDLKDILDCYISPHSREYCKNKIARILSKIFKKEKKTNKYYSFNIVDKYNEYKLFVAPEENIGLPSVNFIEGMACGCAYIGLKDPMYSNLGLVDGVNYIGYDGTLPDLREKIEYYLSHGNELALIAENGYKFVKEHFTEDKITTNFLNLLRNLVDSVNTNTAR